MRVLQSDFTFTRMLFFDLICKYFVIFYIEINELGRGKAFVCFTVSIIFPAYEIGEVVLPASCLYITR